MSDKIFNTKVSRKFNELLFALPYFQQSDKWKLISPCWTVVNNIYKESLKDKGNKQDQIPSEYISYPFNNHKINYIDVLTELLKSGIIADIDWSYRFTDNPIWNKCRKYKLSDNIIDMIQQDDQEYLIKLHTDKVFKRNELKAKNKRKHRYMKKSNNIVHDTNYKNIYNIIINPEDIEYARKSIEDAGGDFEEVKNAIRNLDSTSRRMTDDIDVKTYEKDGRLHNCYNQCPRELRNRLKIKDEEGNIYYNAFDLDYRAMHPSFLGIYIFNHLNPENSLDTNMVDELNKWNELWFGINDPREMLKDLFQYENKQDVKDLLLVSLNEPRYYLDDFRHWFRDNFPNMFELWFNSDKNTTGCNISKNIESQLLRDTQFYLFINKIDTIKVLDVHDGMSIFVREGVDAIEDCHKVIDYQINLCYARFGIKPIIKLEEVI